MKLSPRVIHIAVLASLVIFLLNVRIFGYARMGEYPPEDVIFTAIAMSLLPAAILVVALYFSKGPKQKLFRIMLGVLSMTYAWEFIADPWSVSFRMELGKPLLPLIVYTIIGTVFLLIAVFAFKKIE